MNDDMSNVSEITQTMKSSIPAENLCCQVHAEALCA